MIDPRQIKAEAQEATAKAAKAKKHPYVIFNQEEIEDYRDGHKPFPFPMIGDYIPPSWERVEELFCDSSGLGSSGEAALTKEQLCAKLVKYLGSKDTYGFAITQAGQFQVYVGVYKKVKPAKKK